MDLRSLAPFLVNNSVGCPFVVVSEGGLVDGIPEPGPAEFSRICAAVQAYVLNCEFRGAVMLADFEGEMPGHGGELVTAAFQETTAISGTSLAPCCWPVRVQFPGLLLDLRSPLCVGLVKQIMESMRIVKLIWGADCDFQSLMYQHRPTPLEVLPAVVVDVQLAFSEPSRRLGMKRMLERVPEYLVHGLPDKDQIDFDSFHARNLRCMPLPLTSQTVTYAIDDLRRLEVILETQLPPGGTYTLAHRQTEKIKCELSSDPIGLKSLQNRLHWFDKRIGLKKTVEAVQIKRHIVSIRARGVDFDEQSKLADIERLVTAVLSSAGVAVPEDLSFGSLQQH